MYCPNCGQQQVSQEMRFCSRCGLALSGLAEWLAGGLLVRRTDETPRAPSRQRKNMRRAAKLMFFSVALFPIFFLLCVLTDEPGPLFPPLLIFFASLMWMAYSRLFIEDRDEISQFSPPPVFASVGSRSSLPPPTEMPMPDLRRSQVRTNELAEVPSVTEHTTRLLDNE